MPYRPKPSFRNRITSRGLILLNSRSTYLAQTFILGYESELVAWNRQDCKFQRKLLKVFLNIRLISGCRKSNLIKERYDICTQPLISPLSNHRIQKSKKHRRKKKTPLQILQ